MTDPPQDGARARHIEQRPWGRFERFVQNERCSVKVLTVEAGQQLSLQSHRLREEWWIVLDDEMDVEVDGERSRLSRGGEVYITVGAKHRVFGLDRPCRWLEISFGTFDEEDIIRYEDKYGRDVT